MHPALRLTLAVIAAGIAGTIANAVAAALAIGPDMLNFIYVPGRYLVAIAVAALLPLLYTSIGGLIGWALSFIALTVIPSAILILYLGKAVPWSLALALNAVYALTAIAIYRAIMGRSR